MTRDLRLVPAAGAAWVAAAVGVGVDAAEALGCVVLLASVGLAVAIVAAVWAALRAASGRGGRRRADPRAGGAADMRSHGALRHARAPSPPGVPRGKPPGREGRDRGGRRWPGQLALVAACTTAVLLSAGVELSSRAGVSQPAADGATARVVGVVASGVDPVRNPWTGAVDRYRVTVDLRELTTRGATARASGPVTITGDRTWARVAYGATVEAAGRLGTLGTDVVLRATSSPVDRRPPPASLGIVNAIHTALRAAIQPLSNQARGLVPGVAVGDTSQLDADLDEAMRVTSLTHVTAVSGGHFAIIVAAVTTLCVAGRIPRLGRVAVVVVVTVGFVTLVHPQPSVLRAAVMGGVGSLGLLLGRPSRALSALAATVIVLLVVDPWLARSYGFVLSAVATAGLVLGTGPVSRRLEPWCGAVVARLVAVPTAAQAACAPVLVLLDPGISLYAVPANLLAAPALGPATVFGVLAALAAPVWPPGATALAWLAGLGTWWIAAVARFFAGLPGARIPWPPGVAGLLLLGGLTAAAFATMAWWRSLARVAGITVRARPDRRPPDLLGFLRKVPPSRLAAASVLVLGVISTGAWAWPSVLRAATGPPDDWAIVACDVGQGDALVVRTGPRSAALVDVGPDGDAAARCLDSVGIDHLDLLVLTHFHADHVGGLAEVLRGRAVDRALVTGLGEPAAQADRTLDLLDAAGTPVEIAVAGRRGEIAGEAGGDGVEWTVLAAGPDGDGRAAGDATGGDAETAASEGARAAPDTAASAGERAESAEGSDANDASIALALTVHGLTVVALGDLEEPGQERLAIMLARGGYAEVDVVKVAHHGSASQSRRLAALLRPLVAVVSSGENTYGHPTRQALDLYRDSGAAILRTDACGTFAILARAGALFVSGCE